MAASVEERLDRIRDAFAVVVADSRRGREFVAAQMEETEPDSDTHKQWLACLPDALEVVAMDDRNSDTAFLKLILLPDRDTIAVFYSDMHSKHSVSLLARLSSALEERLEVFTSGVWLARRTRTGSTRGQMRNAPLVRMRGD